MKFMKLGSRPDTFYTTEEAVRSVSCEVPSDIIVQVKGSRYLLHKFPLLSKCLHLQRLCSESPESSNIKIVQLPDFPGGDDTFELCAKFCYGITITLSAYNIVATRCAAEYLQMTEDIEKGNLIYKLDIFLNCCILQGWKDSIMTLQSTRSYPMWSEELGITRRCVEAVVNKVLTNPSKASLSHSHSRRGRDNMSLCSGRESRGWWAEDIAELSLDLHWRTMITIKAAKKIPCNLIGDALKVYATRWLSKRDESGSDSANEITSNQRMVLESIVSLLPMERSAVSCSFLLKLLKASNILNASLALKTDLARRAGLQLEEATPNDLLIHDVDMVMIMLEQFMLQWQSPPTSPLRSKTGLERRRRSRSEEHIDYEFQESRRSSSASHSSKLKVVKLMDRYLQVIAQDPNLPVSKFVTISETLPDFSRPDHDDLYRAIDIYLKAHPDLSKSERKRLCRVVDCKKLSVEASKHAVQNELLPLRVVVQVLFFEQARAGIAGGEVTELQNKLKALFVSHKDTTRLCTKPEDEWSVLAAKSPASRLPRLKMKLTEEDGSLRPLSDLPSRPKTMFSKLRTISRSASEKNRR